VFLSLKFQIYSVFLTEIVNHSISFEIFDQLHKLAFSMTLNGFEIDIILWETCSVFMNVSLWTGCWTPCHGFCRQTGGDRAGGNNSVIAAVIFYCSVFRFAAFCNQSRFSAYRSRMSLTRFVTQEILNVFQNVKQNYRHLGSNSNIKGGTRRQPQTRETHFRKNVVRKCCHKRLSDYYSCFLTGEKSMKSKQ